MPKRRTDAEIQAVKDLHNATSDVARAISGRVNGDDPGDSYIAVDAFPMWNYKADHQRSVADILVVSFESKDPALIERVASAIKAELTR